MFGTGDRAGLGGADDSLPLMKWSRSIVLAAITVVFAGCAEDKPDLGQVAAKWRADPATTAFDIAKDEWLEGLTRAQVVSALGPPDSERRNAQLTWSNGCSGRGCYTLVLSLKDGNVADATFRDES